MGKEIELKIPLSQVQYDDLYKKIFGEKNCTGVKVLDSSSEQIYKHDEYFTKYATLEERAEKNEPQVIRLRTESVSGDKQCFFTIKRKTVQNGIEVNKEDETLVSDENVLRLFFEEAGYRRWFNKEKKAYSSHCVLDDENEASDCGIGQVKLGQTIFHLELVEVNKMLYVEVEVVSDEDTAETENKLCGKGSADLCGQKKLPESNLKAELEKFVLALGLNPADKDPRSWYQIISENFC
jgi:adenylate cyclase class IV